MVMRREGWSDERWYWEQRLSAEGLGELAGGSGYLDYGYEEQDSKKPNERRRAAKA